MSRHEVTRPLVVRAYGLSGRHPEEHRVLVDRLWPRGIASESLDLDEWLKEVAPSTPLRKWYGHDPDRFEEFSRRYREELASPPGSELLEYLREVSAHRRLVLITATKDVEHSGAIVLADVIVAGVSVTTTPPQAPQRHHHPRAHQPPGRGW